MGLRQRDYWDHHYEEELKNFENDGDEGEIWFGKGLTRKIVAWIIKRIREDSGRRTESQSIIDIGCGNAFLLTTFLTEATSLPIDCMDIIGLDYSHNSIELSRKLIESKSFEDKITLKECDFLDSSKLQGVTSSKRYDFIVDKGTFDAICLIASDSDQALVEAKKKYVESLRIISKSGTVFVLASCNHTEDELIDLLRGHGCDFKVVDRIETPKLQFGGKEGSQVCCLIINFN